MNQKNVQRDIFLYLLAIITLVASAVTFGMLVYQFINLKFPDPLQNPYGHTYTSASYQTIRGALAGLVVLFPVFFWVSRFLRADIQENPGKKELKIRRWLFYLIVFAASLVVIGDLVALIYNFLNGELTMRFVLKVLTIFFIAGSALFYYLSELRERSYSRKASQAIIGTVVIAAAVYGFYVAGLPQNQRLARFDDVKVSHLQMIQNQLVYYWQQKGTLPQSLEALNDSISGFTLPKDPQMGQVYEYNLRGQRSFQLCANFNLESYRLTEVGSVPSMGDNWAHGAGKVCFDRTIDEALYPAKPTR